MTTVMIAGLPGKMSTLVANAIEETQDMDLVYTALAEIDDEMTLKPGSSPIKLVSLSNHEKEIIKWGPDIVVDFTAPDAVNRNAKLYCQCSIPFVMGTTGGDRELLKKTVEESETCAVIATNMSKQIVVFQSMMQFAAENFPDAFKGYRMMITESHQSSKKDVSGTAKGLLQYFNALGIPFTAEQIFFERDPDRQRMIWGIPEKYLTGHGYHTYTLLSGDGTVLFQFKHNVQGRSTYVEGALDAIGYLYDQVCQEAKGMVFSMIDVLKKK